MRYRLRTLLIVVAIGPPVLAWAWFHSVPLGIVLGVCLFGTVLGRTLLWGIEGIVVVTSSLIATIRRAMRRQKRETEGEFSLSHYTANAKARRKE